jgi:hypothetical protein
VTVLTARHVAGPAISAFDEVDKGLSPACEENWVILGELGSSGWL